MHKYNTLKSFSQYKLKDFEELEQEHAAKTIGKSILIGLACYGIMIVGLIF